MSFEEHDEVNMDEVPVTIKDMRNTDVNFRLLDHGFEVVKLQPSLLPFLRDVLEKGLDGGRQGVQWGINEKSAESALANALEGFGAFQLHNLWHYNIKCAGFVMRAGTPLGKKMVPMQSQPGSSNRVNFDMVAQRVHIDQDLEGEPLRSLGVMQLLQMPFMELFNVWVPLMTSPIRPLAFADIRTMNATHMLRYRANSTKNAGGRNGSFSSDRMMALHHHEQKWYYNSGIEFGDAFIFSTGRTPHSSFSLPGEDALSKHLLRFTAMRELLLQFIGHGRIDEAIVVHKEMCATPMEPLDTAAMDPRVGILVEFLDTEMSSWCKRVEKAVAASASMAQRAEGKDQAEQMAMELSELIQRALTRRSLEIRCVALVASTTEDALGHAGIVLAAVLATAALLCAPHPRAPTATSGGAGNSNSNSK
jgi:hypothetical protein